jgi:hypothetical protein
VRPSLRPSLLSLSTLDVVILSNAKNPRICFRLSPLSELPARSKKARSRYARQRAFGIRMCFCYLAAPDNAANTLCAW